MLKPRGMVLEQGKVTWDGFGLLSNRCPSQNFVQTAQRLLGFTLFCHLVVQADDRILKKKITT